MATRQLDIHKNSLTRQRPRIWAAGRIRSFAEGSLIGLMIGLRDTLHGDDESRAVTGALYLIASIALGFRNAGRASLCWPPLGVSLFVAHLIAMHFGAKPPFVEANFRQATFTLGIYPLVRVGLFIGAVGRIAVNALGLFRRTAGPPGRFWPRTWPSRLFIVLCFGLGFANFGLAQGPRTVYAVGYDEFKFKELRTGMTWTEVEAALGPPLETVPKRDDVPEVWFYSLGETSLDDYWRRWVWFRNGKVTEITSDYWED
jgi:hypothetical protein